MKLYSISSLLLAFVCCLIPISVFSQQKEIAKGNEYYQNLAFAPAIKYYEKAIARGAGKDALVKLADCYRLTKDYSKAEETYARVVELEGIHPVNYLYYGQSLMSNEKYLQAAEWFGKYRELVPEDIRGRKFERSCNDIALLYEEQDTKEIKNAEFNHESADFGPAFYRKGIVFASSRREGAFRTSYEWDQQPFLDLYYVEMDTGAKTLSKPKLLKGTLNSRFHEANASFSPDEKLIFFTRNNFYDGKKRKDENGIIHLQIFYGELSNKGWKNLKSLPFNSNDYSVGHPALSPDGTVLYFSSDMPGGYGGTDLYLSNRNGDSWSTPVNLGPAINTAGDELFPFLHRDGTLYFASDGHGGLGGLDVFMSHYDSGWTVPVNLQAPVNSSKDDFGYIVNVENQFGYFSSNRSGGVGLDDIYYFKIKDPVLAGLVVSMPSGLPMQEASVKLINISSGEERSFYTPTNGAFSNVLQLGSDYKLLVQKPGYQTKEILFSTKEVLPGTKIEKRIEMQLEPLELLGNVIVQGTDEPIKGARIKFIDVDLELNSSAKGSFKTNVDPSKNYMLEVSREGYITKTVPFEPQLNFGTERITIALKPDPAKLLLEGYALNKETGERLEGVEVKLEKIEGGEPQFVKTDTSGYYSFGLKRGEGYKLQGEKTGFFTRKKEVRTAEVTSATIRQNLHLDKVVVGESFVLKNIYYDFDKWNIRMDATPELNKLANFLKDNPTIRIELSSHTDARGGDSYNLDLSQKRAEAVVSYLLQQNLDPSRIIATGYGEQKPLNRCVNGVSCPEELHQLNRRTEFTIIGFSDPIYSEALAVDEVTGEYYSHGYRMLEDNPRARTDFVGAEDESNVQEVTTQPEKTENIIIDTPISDNSGEYSIQLGIFRYPVRAKNWEKLGSYKNDLYKEKVGELNRYRVGKYDSYEEALSHLKKIKNKGYKDAFIANSTPQAAVSQSEATLEEEVVESVQQVNTMLEYRVQVGVFTKEASAAFLNKLGGDRQKLQIEQVGNVKRYSIGGYATYGQVKPVLDRLKSSGFSDAFIIALYNKQRIPVKKALTME